MKISTPEGVREVFYGCSSLTLLDPELPSPIPAGIKNQSTHPHA